MNIHYTIAKALAFGLIGISLTFLLAIESAAQTGNNLKANVKILPGPPAELRTKSRFQHNAPAKPLSLADKQVMLQSLLKALADEHKSRPGLNLHRVFPLTNTTFNFTAPIKPIMLSANHLVIENVASLNIVGSVVGDTYFGDRYIELIGPGGGVDSHDMVDINLKLTPEAHVLDFTINPLAPGPIVVLVQNFSGPPTTIQTSVSQGHLLIPVFGSTSGQYQVTVTPTSACDIFSIEVKKLQ